MAPGSFEGDEGAEDIALQYHSPGSLFRLSSQVNDSIDPFHGCIHLIIVFQIRQYDFLTCLLKTPASGFSSRCIARPAGLP
jgi:hypothetical protein